MRFAFIPHFHATLASFALAGLAAGLAPAAHAQSTVDYSVVLAAGSPTFNRPIQNGTAAPIGLSGVGNNVFYQAQSFFVNTTGTYTLSTPSATLTDPTGNGLNDTYLVLYQTSFTPTSPLANALQADDQSGGGNLALIQRMLNANTQYVLVTTTFGNGASGTVNTRIAGPTGSVVTLGVVGAAAPEPGSLALLGMGALPLVGMVARRRRSNTLVA